VIGAAFLSREALLLSGAVKAPWSRLKGALHAAAVGMLSSLAVGVWSAGHSSYTLNITGTVPTVCYAEFTGTPAGDGEGSFDLGTLAEFCNSAGGYQVWLDTASGLTGTVLVDGARIPLSPTGATLIHSSNRAARNSVHVYLDMPQTRIDKLSVRIVPL